MSFLFTSESVSDGHPDKVCDAISDALLDAHLSKDKSARCAIETMATTDHVFIAGEISSQSPLSSQTIEETVRNTIKNIGYNQTGFSWQTVKIKNYLHRQSPDIALGVDKQGAGDQGIMFGYAQKEEGFATEQMPISIFLAHKLLKNLASYRRSNPSSGLGPDAKSQITVEYASPLKPIFIPKIVLSTQHSANTPLDKVSSIVKQIIHQTIPSNLLSEQTEVLINPTGRFVIGGPDGDTGLTGRKIIVDTYGGAAPHGGGAFSGKDATKVDRSAAYMLRYLAKNIVASGIANRCLLQISYAIGVTEPLSLYINTFGTSFIKEADLIKWIKTNIDLSPQGIISHLHLRNPIYSPTSAFGHFGRTPRGDGTFTWEQTNLIKELQNAFKL
ncbi:MAG: methionine adenosyltransferase [Alphaproteobacteria bacterium]|nr:methionine adenosyltransferase [Alphaproteobacteria bacterium]